MSEQPALFESVDAVMDALREHGYIADIRLATIVFLVTRLDKPLLVEGPAGVGKTELAKALALISGRRLLRLQCYEGQDETKALYEWDYGKQLLYTQILREKIGQVVADAPDLESAVDRITNHVLGDACTPGNAKECTFETVRPVVEHCMNGAMDELLS